MNQKGKLPISGSKNRMYQKPRDHGLALGIVLELVSAFLEYGKRQRRDS